MKIARVLNAESGGPVYAEARPGNRFLLLEGHPFEGGLRETGKEVKAARLLRPVEPPVIYGIGLNYRKHAEETGKAIPERPVVFMKAPTAAQDPGAPIELPRHCASKAVDFEGELAVIIGRRGKNIPRERALEYVWGYTCANDVSARDWQHHLGGGQWIKGKSFDTFCPLGPWAVTPDEIPDPAGLALETWVAGERMQQASTGDMVFDVAVLIAFLSGSVTLLPGTVILTGTPSGVGAARDPHRWLKPGEEVRVEIDAIGTLSNPVVEEAVP
ncbi:MAG: fumarylacetoacetate hydrolase family protein [Kiritimatiellia bacterium]